MIISRFNIPGAALFVAATMASVAAVGWLQAQPRNASEVAVIFPPWIGRETALLRVVAAGGLVEREGALDTILVVRGDGTRLGSRLYAEGAWAVVDPVAFGGCLLKAPTGAS